MYLPCGYDEIIARMITTSINIRRRIIVILYITLVP